MDRPVPLEQGGFPVHRGGAYRITAWIAKKAFDTWAFWNVPGRDDITKTVQGAGWSDPHVFLPLDELPPDWPAEPPTLPSDAFVIRVEGTWQRDPATWPAELPLPIGSEPLHVAQVWEHGSDQPAPGPPSPPIDPPPPAQKPPAPRPPPRRPPNPGPSPGPRPPPPQPPQREPAPRGSGGAAPIVIGSLALGVLFLLAHAGSHARKTLA